MIFYKIYSIISVLVAAVLAFIGQLFNANMAIPFIAFLSISSLGILIAALIRKEKLARIILSPCLIALFVLMSIQTTKTAVLIPAAISQTINTSQQAREVSSGVNYKPLFTYNDQTYYISNDYTTLCNIYNDGFYGLTALNTANVYPSDYFNDKQLLAFTAFYQLSDVKAVNLATDIRIDYAFMNETTDNSILLRIYDNLNNKVYYTYLVLDDPNDFFNTNTSFVYQYNVGSLSLYMSLPTASGTYSADGEYTVDNSETSVSLVLTSSTSFQSAQAQFVEFDSLPPAVDRVVSFMGHNAEQDDQDNYFVELVNEITINEANTPIVRLYRACTADEYLSENRTTNQIDVIEICDKNQYVYAHVSMLMSDVF